MTDAERIKELEAKIKLYEQNGAAKLYYSLNRKLSEMADLLNAVSLKNIDISAKQDASFDRVFKLLEKSEGISTAAKTLGEFAGISGNEALDTQTPRYKIATPESMADNIGEIAGMKK
jgi:hypothetical protein